MERGGIIKAISGASFLLVLIFALLFLYSQTFASSAIYPQDHELWNVLLTGYLVIFAIAMIGALIFAPEVVKSLAKANYWKAVVFRFVPVALVYGFLLIALKAVVKGADSVNLFESVSYMPFLTLLFHAVVVTQVEEILFGGLLYTAIEKRAGSTSANWITVIVFSIFHFAKTGGSIPVLLTYIPLRLWFNYTRNNGVPTLNQIPGIGQKLFGPSPQTQQANAGAHFAWNAFIIGF